MEGSEIREQPSNSTNREVDGTAVARFRFRSIRATHYGRSFVLKKATTAALNSLWNAARSKPAGSRQASGATFANAGVHGARNTKWPAFGTTWYSGFVGSRS